MPSKLCLRPGCPNPRASRGYCRAHTPTRNNTDQRRIYNSKRWTLTRRHQLDRHPLCECGEIATDVHHLKDLADGGNPWSPDNLQSLCHACHATITRARQTSGVGWPE